MFKSINNETICQAVLDGMELEYVYSPTALEETLAWNPKRVIEAASREHCTVLSTTTSPTDPGAGSASSTTAPEAREWAISTFERVRDEARPVELQAFESLTTLDRPA